MSNRNEREAVGVVAVMMCALTVAAVGCTQADVSSPPNSDVALTTSSPSRPVTAPVSDLLVRQSEFPSIGGNQYSQDDSAQGYTAARRGPIDACDRLMWPAKEYPDVVHRSAYYDPPPEHGGQSMAATIFMHELPSLGGGRGFRHNTAELFELRYPAHGIRQRQRQRTGRYGHEENDVDGHRRSRRRR